MVERPGAIVPRTVQDVSGFGQSNGVLFVSTIEYDTAAVEKFLKKEGITNLLKEVLAAISQLEAFDTKHLEDALRGVNNQAWRWVFQACPAVKGFYHGAERERRYF